MAPSPSGRRGRTKCFTGCWTCRRRRVGCDEAKPACRRCTRRGVSCEGYGLRLTWVPMDQDGEPVAAEGTPTPPARSFSTRVGFSNPPRLSSPEIDDIVGSIDGWRPGWSDAPQQSGFAVFTSDFPTSHLPERNESDPSGRVGSEALQSTVAEHRGPARTVASPSIAADSSTIESEVFTPFDAHHGLASPDPVLQDRHDCQESFPMARALLSLGEQGAASRHPLPTPQDTPASTESPRPAPVPTSSLPSPRHLDALAMPACQTRLIHHWVTFTSRRLVLVDEPHNPCRTLMLPMASAGLSCGAADSNAHVAVFHALCASAAYNLFELHGRRDEADRTLALKHDQQAIFHLRTSLSLTRAGGDQGPGNPAVAMAIMACIAVEAISGTTQRWRTHVAGGLAYLEKLHSYGVDEATIAPFRQHMVSMAILCDVPVPAMLKAFLDNPATGHGLELTFPYYGVSKSFLVAQDRINALAAGLESHGSTPVSEKELDAFELQLYLSFPSLPPPGTASEASPLGIIVQHMSRVFYYAQLVFFQRSVRRAAVETVQALVELGLSDLEAVERVGKGELGCMMLWPVLVIGAECGTAETRRRMRAWFDAQRKLGFRNLVVLEDLIATVWERRDAASAAQTNVDWRHLILLPKFDVFRL